MAVVRISITSPHDANSTERSFDMYIPNSIGSFYGPTGKAGDPIDALVRHIRAFTTSGDMF